jgi:predicted nucleic acid-binding protein
LSAVVLDAGALVAVDRGDRAVVLLLRRAASRGDTLRTTGVVVAQAWRDPRGRQAELARLLRAVDVRPVDEQMGRAAGALLGRSGTSDAVDATVALVAEDGDRILTSDPRDIERLVRAAGTHALIVRC